jgi:large subunit ribosomal protein L30
MADETSTPTRGASPAAAGNEGPVLRVTLVRSPIGYDRKQAQVVRGLGLRRMGQTVVVKDQPSLRGMIAKVQHLVSVEYS